LFGGGNHRNNNNNGVYGGDPTPWWARNGDVRPYNDKRSRMRISQSDASDPEAQIPGLGMGTIKYTAPPTAPVFDASFISLQEAAPDAEAIRVVLADKTTSIKAQDVERKSILSFYKTREFKPVWMADGHLTPAANDILKTLSSAGEDGLYANNYLPEVLSSFDKAETQVGTDAVKQARLDVGLTLAAVHYARQMTGGQFDPNKLSLYNDIKVTPVDADEALKQISSGTEPASYLKDLAPKNPEYAAFKSELAKLADSGADKFTPIPAGPTIGPGKVDARMPLVRQRLQQLGFIGSDVTAPDDQNKLDQDLAISLMAFQTSQKLKPTGKLDPVALKALNKNEAYLQRLKLIASMERLRWLPSSLGSRYVFVNQAAFNVNVMSDGKSVWKSRVIVGQQTKQTYSFYNQIQTVVFNPRWGVPASIIVNEYAPKMRKDPGYLDRNNFIVIDQRGNRIDSQSIDWYSVGRNPNFGMQQLAGGGNALGELKFLFPNSHDIYMHDTPTKDLFKDPVRAYSHGCVRVQNPREFAQMLLNWSSDAVVRSLGNSDTHSVTLQQKVPVYLTYFTAWTDDSGKIQYFDDIYGRDDAMARAFAYDAGLNKSGSADVVAQGAAPQQTSVSGGITQN
jgi:L,D-transpeptidase YcbB